MSRRLPSGGARGVAPPGQYSNRLPRLWYLPRHLRHPRARQRLAPSAAAALAAAGAAGLVGCGLVGCGSAPAPGGAAASTPARAAVSPGSTAPRGPVSPSQSATSPVTGVSGCTSSGLRVRLDTAAGGVAAGSYFVPLDFTNISGQACELGGYPAVALTMGVSGAQVGAVAATDQAVQAGPVVLSPGGTAHAWLQVVSTSSYPAARCHPVTAAGLRVTAPGTASASYVAHPVPACRAVIRGSELLTVHPIQRGQARRGTA